MHVGKINPKTALNKNQACRNERARDEKQIGKRKTVKTKADEAENAFKELKHVICKKK